MKDRMITSKRQNENEKNLIGMAVVVVGLYDENAAMKMRRNELSSQVLQAEMNGVFLLASM